MEKADGLMYYRKYCEAAFKHDPTWTIEGLAEILKKEVGIQHEKAIQAATEAKANVDKEAADASKA